MKKEIFQEQNYIYWLTAITLLIKLFLLPFSQTVNADAVSRIYAAVNWAENPTWITHNFWAPFHFYIHGVGLILWNNPIYTPKIVTVLFSVFTLIPFYYLTKREFNKNGAFVASCLLAISPILFHNSFLALSETPYLFFLTLSLNLLSKSIREHSITQLAFAGLAITIAAGIRYEAWIIIAICTLVLFLIKQWKYIFLYNAVALIFPIYWLISSWLTTGNPLYSFDGTYHWALEVMGNNDHVNFESYLRRIWFFPFSWVIAIGIPVGFIVLKTMINSYSKKERNLHYILLSIPLLIMVLFFQYNTFKGVLLLQHRYVGTLVVLSLPFIAPFFNDLSYKKIKIACFFGGLTIVLSLVYNTSGVKPIPRLGDQYPTKIVALIKENTTENSCLILDFIGWDNTYFIALQSKLPLKQIVIIEGAKNSSLPLQQLEDKISTYPKGILLVRKNSELEQQIIKYHLLTSILYQNKEILLLQWKK